MSEYDSRPDTYEHIAKVRGYVLDCVHDLIARADIHDLSKLESPEKEMFDKYTPKLSDPAMVYGSDEYKATTKAMKDEGLDHHFEVNDHHPEHFPNGFKDMNLIQIIEMLCDWKAAGERHADGGDIKRSITIQQQKLGFSDDVMIVMMNTARYLGWIT
jgi:hypothetical protein